jgi:hypothetical protein
VPGSNFGINWRVAPQGSTLLYLELRGNARLPVAAQRVDRVRRRPPSPDSRHLAMAGLADDRNVWMMEKF